MEFSCVEERLGVLAISTVDVVVVTGVARSTSRNAAGTGGEGLG